MLVMVWTMMLMLLTGVGFVTSLLLSRAMRSVGHDPVLT
jgi:hypothetical protein